MKIKRLSFLGSIVSLLIITVFTGQINAATLDEKTTAVSSSIPISDLDNIDLTSPSITTIEPSDNSIFNSKAKITVRATDNIAVNSIKLQYSLDGVKWCDIGKQNIDSVTDGLIAWYKFDGNTDDSTANKMNGQKSSTGTITYVNGINGQGAKFDGNQSYVLLPTMTNKLDQGSISLYFRPDEWDVTKGLGFLFSSTKNPPGGCYDGVNLGMHSISTGTPNLLFGIYDSSWYWANSGIIPQPNQWYHVVGTWSKSGIKIYVNGKKLQENPYNNGAQLTDNYDIIGGSSWPDSFFKGTIDDFKIYNRALNDSEIAKLYEANATAEFIWDTTSLNGSVKVRAIAVDSSENESTNSPVYTYTISPDALSIGETHVNIASLSDVSVNIGENKISSIMNGSGTLIPSVDYNVLGSNVTISKSYFNYYFEKFPNQNLYLNFYFKDGSSSVFTVYTGDTPHVVLTDALSYKLGSGDAELSLSPNGNFITSVKNGNELLVPRIDYTYSPSTNIFYIREGYLNSCFSKALEPLKIIVGFTGDSPKSVVITPVK